MDIRFRGRKQDGLGEPEDLLASRKETDRSENDVTGGLTTKLIL